MADKTFLAHVIADKTNDIKFKERCQRYNLPLDQNYVSNPDNWLARFVAITHTSAVNSRRDIKNPQDDIAEIDLRHFDTTKKPVTMNHGQFGGFEYGWAEKPPVVGHTIGQRMDEKNQMLEMGCIHNTPDGERALKGILNGELRDVSPFFFANRSTQPVETKSGKKKAKMLAYACNHLALCSEGRRTGTHILSLQCRDNGKTFSVKNPDIVNQSNSTRTASKFFTASEDEVGDFFVGQKESPNPTMSEAQEQQQQQATSGSVEANNEEMTKMDVDGEASSTTETDAPKTGANGANDDDSMELEDLKELSEEEKEKLRKGGIDPDEHQTIQKALIDLVKKTPTPEILGHVEALNNYLGKLEESLQDRSLELAKTNEILEHQRTEAERQEDNAFISSMVDCAQAMTENEELASIASEYGLSEKHFEVLKARQQALKQSDPEYCDAMQRAMVCFSDIAQKYGSTTQHAMELEQQVSQQSSQQDMHAARNAMLQRLLSKKKSPTSRSIGGASMQASSPCRSSIQRPIRSIPSFGAGTDMAIANSRDDPSLRFKNASLLAGQKRRVPLLSGDEDRAMPSSYGNNATRQKTSGHESDRVAEAIKAMRG